MDELTNEGTEHQKILVDADEDDAVAKSGSFIVCQTDNIRKMTGVQWKKKNSNKDEKIVQ
eukprot:13848225-Ditylum_brightwellii.AAC.1